jgi:hypothetical protein
MSIPRPAQPAKLVVGAFLAEKSLLPEIAGRLEERFGPLDAVSAWMAFDYTTYYREEMGSPLFRRMMAFQTLVDQDRLPEVKLATNELETLYAREGKRRVNVDPGFVLLERFVLATGKNFSHRIYLRDGIYADLTLIYRHGGFHKLPWTYPDYADRALGRFLLKVRERYAAGMKACSPGR